MRDSNVGLGMAPCKPNCRCWDCQIDRLQQQNREFQARANLAAERERILLNALNSIASKTGSHDPCQAMVKLARHALAKYKEQSDE